MKKCIVHLDIGGMLWSLRETKEEERIFSSAVKAETVKYANTWGKNHIPCLISVQNIDGSVMYQMMFTRNTISST